MTRVAARVYVCVTRLSRALFAATERGNEEGNMSRDPTAARFLFSRSTSTYGLDDLYRAIEMRRSSSETRPSRRRTSTTMNFVIRVEANERAAAVTRAYFNGNKPASNR